MPTLYTQKATGLTKVCTVRVKSHDGNKSELLVNVPCKPPLYLETGLELKQPGSQGHHERPHKGRSSDDYSCVDTPKDSSQVLVDQLLSKVHRNNQRNCKNKKDQSRVTSQAPQLKPQVMQEPADKRFNFRSCSDFKSAKMSRLIQEIAKNKLARLGPAKTR